MNLLTILKNLNYSPINTNVEKIARDSTKNVLGDQFGHVIARELISTMSSEAGLSEDEFLSNSDLVKMALHRLMGETGKNTILQSVKEEMLREVLSDLTVNQLLKIIHEIQVIKFIHQVGAREHIIFLYKNQNSKDRILSEFFDPIHSGKTPKGLLSHKPTQLKFVNNLLYDELFHADKDVVMKRLSRWVSRLHSSNKSNMPTRIADEDVTWWIKNGFADEHLKLEEKLGRRSDDNMLILCAYDISSMNDKQIGTVIAPHGLVILDDPLSLYKRGMS